MAFVRWMIRPDTERVLEIDAQSYDPAWDEQCLFRELRKKNVIGMIVERDDQVVGFMVYDLSKRSVNVLRFAVAAGYRREGIGTAMVEKLKGKLSAQRRSRCRFVVHEADLGGHLFLRACGFRAERVLRNHFGDGDGYAFEYSIRETIKE